MNSYIKFAFFTILIACFPSNLLAQSPSPSPRAETPQSPNSNGQNKTYTSMSSLIADTINATDLPSSPKMARQKGDVSEKARPFVDAMQAYYDAAKTYSASFEQNYETVDGVKKTSSGVVWFKKPGLMRWDYEKPEARFLISDGEFFWSWEPVYRQFCKQSLKSSQLPTALTFLAGTGRIEDDFSIELAHQNENQVELVLTPITPSIAFESIRFHILMPSAKVYRVVIYDAMGNLNAITFKSPEINAPLSDESFQFTPPADAKQICD